MDDQQVVITIDQADGRLTAEIDISFVDNNHRIRIRIQYLLDGGKCQQTTRWCIRVRKNDAAVRSTAIISQINTEIFRQRHGFVINAIQSAINRVKTVGDIREKNRLIVLEQRHENMC